MAILSKKYKLLYIQVPRTGSTSVEKALCEQLDGVKLAPTKELIEKYDIHEKARKHLTLQELISYEMIDKEIAEQCYKFCTIRHPFERAQSLFAKMRFGDSKLINKTGTRVSERKRYKKLIISTTKRPFNAWVIKRYCFSAMWRLLGFRRTKRSYYHQFTEGMDFVMKLETLDRDFDKVMKLNGIPDMIGLEKINRSTRDKCIGGWSWLSSIVHWITFADDYKKYGYGRSNSTKSNEKAPRELQK